MRGSVRYGDGADLAIRIGALGAAGPATFGLARLDARLAGGEIALRAADA
jgi:hypothetical protein